MHEPSKKKLESGVHVLNLSQKRIPNSPAGEYAELLRGGADGRKRRRRRGKARCEKETYFVLQDIIVGHGIGERERPP